MEGSGLLSPENLGQAQQKESNRLQHGERYKVTLEDGSRWSYLRYGNSESKKKIVEVHGGIGASAIGHDRLSLAFAGKVSGSLGFQDLERNNPQEAQRITAVIEALDGEYDIIVPDLPGFGVTDPLENPSTKEFAQKTIAFLKAIKIENPMILAFSSSGRIGIDIAADESYAIRGLILYGAATKASDINKIGYYGLKAAGAAGRFERAARLLNNRLARAVYGLGAMRDPELRKSDKETQQLIISAGKRADPKTALATGWEFGVDISDDKLRQVKCPVVVVGIQNDNLTPIHKSREIAERFHLDDHGKVTFLEFQDHSGIKSGHLSLITNAEQLVAQLAPIMDKIMQASVG